MEMKIEQLLDTKGVTVAFRHPTPRAVTWGCEGYDNPEVFDPTDEEALAEAQVVCGACVSRSVCFALGVSRAEWGVWGGVLLEGGKPIEKVRKRGRPQGPTAA